MASRIPPNRPRVVQWRASHGPRGQRLGFSPAEAASIGELPTRTLQRWAADGLCVPTVPVEVGIPRPLFSAGDILVAKLLHDLTERGTARWVIESVASEMHSFRTSNIEAIDIRKAAVSDLVLVIATDEELVFDGEVISYVSPSTAAKMAEGLEDVVIVWPFHEVARKLVERTDEWWRRVGTKHDKRPAWM